MLYFYFLWFELLSFIIALLFIPGQQRSKLVLFIPFLLLTNLVEWGSRYGWFNIHHSNNWILNIFTNVEFVFYSYLFFIFSDDARRKRKIKIILSAYLALALTNILLIQGYDRFHSYTFLVGSLMIIYFCCNFYFSLFKVQIYINLIRYPMFWITSGLLFFYCGMFCYFTFYEAYAYKYFLDYYKLFNVLTNIFNILLYSCFSVAFICRRTNPI